MENNRKPRGNFVQDERGRTALFYAAEQGLLAEVEAIIFSETGTGMFPTRLALLQVKDHANQQAADVAEAAGHAQIASLLRGEESRMEWAE